MSRFSFLYFGPPAVSAVLIATCPHLPSPSPAPLLQLPDRELASGISEIIKYGLIRDADLFAWLEENMGALLARDPAATMYAIERSCVNKAEVVAQDEREGGVRATLNLGHTFGHAIETATGYGSWLHGEAVAAGTAMAADMSVRLGWIDESIRDRCASAAACCHACGLLVLESFLGGGRAAGGAGSPHVCRSSPTAPSTLSHLPHMPHNYAITRTSCLCSASQPQVCNSAALLAGLHHSAAPLAPHLRHRNFHADRVRCEVRCALLVGPPRLAEARRRPAGPQHVPLSSLVGSGHCGKCIWHMRCWMV